MVWEEQGAKGGLRDNVTPRPPAWQICAHCGRERPPLTRAFKANLFQELNLSHDVKPRKAGLKCGKKLRHQTWLRHLFKNDLRGWDIKILRPAAGLVVEDLKNNNYC